MAEALRKLNLGCGKNKMEGWVNIDSVAGQAPDLVHDMGRPLPFEDESVDEIIADGLLEHFDKYARHLAFYDWARVLKIGGKITVGVPNFPKILRRYFKFSFDDFVDTVFGENMWDGQTYLGQFGIHKWGYSERSLREFAALFGSEAEGVVKESLYIRMTGRKVRHVTAREAGGFRVYSSANAAVAKKPSLSVEEIREKVKTRDGP